MTEQAISELSTLTSNLSVNRGTGAGGANTNINGVKLEDQVRTTISKNIEVIKSEETDNKWKIEMVMIEGNEYIRAPEYAFKRYEVRNGTTSINGKLAGTILPDDALINEVKKYINWLEAKRQDGTGSVSEKLQTPNLKKENLKERFPDYDINYIYILDHKFKEIAPAEINYLKKYNVPYIFDNDTDFEKNLLKLIK